MLVDNWRHWHSCKEHPGFELTSQSGDEIARQRIFDKAPERNEQYSEYPFFIRTHGDVISTLILITDWCEQGTLKFSTYA